MKDETKADKFLGANIHNYLVEMGVETPSSDLGSIQRSDKQERIDKISLHYREIMNLLNLDLNDTSLIDTPNRVAKMYCNELFYGLNYDNFPKCTLFDVKHDEMIIVDNIKVMSVCEHHIQTISGKAHIGYIPKNGCIGLSKLNRIVDFFSRRPQVQERLTEQVFYALRYVLGTDDIGVMVEADHFCVKARGVGDQCSMTKTMKLGGSFKEHHVKSEFISLIDR